MIGKCWVLCDGWFWVLMVLILLCVGGLGVVLEFFDDEIYFL